MAKKLDLATFIEEMGPALTSPEVEMRLKGTTLLSDIVALIDNDYLNEVQLNFLTTFYIDRLKDHHSVLPAVISGVLSMIQMKHFPNNMSSKLLVALFQNVTCQSQVRDDRSNIFRIFKELSETKPAGNL
jgi:DNA repair/transcription protein MET18/MMS19